MANHKIHVGVWLLLKLTVERLGKIDSLKEKKQKHQTQNINFDFDEIYIFYNLLLIDNTPLLQTMNNKLICSHLFFFQPK